MKAALYARYSTELQSEASIEDQLRVCERIADRERFKVVARFSDAAVSGGTAQRPAYQRMLAAARRGEFSVIVAEDSSRLWRELAEQWRALKELADLGVHVVGHGIDTRREEAKILLAVNGAMAEAYRDEIARRTRRGLEGRAIASQPTGGRAYGYVAARDSGTGKVEIDADAAEVVRRIFTLYSRGVSPRAIAATLNAEGVPSPGAKWKREQRRSDGRWLASAIHGDPTRGTGILNNARYVGQVVWGRSRWKRGAADSAKRRMTMLDSPTHEYRDERLRIVPQRLWNAVKAKQAERRRTLGAQVRGALRKRAPGGGRPPRYLLSGLLRCGVCDASFTMANGERYACASHVNGRACTNAITVRRDLVEARVIGRVKRDLRDPAVVEEFERRLRAALAKKPAAKPSDREAARLRAEVTNLVDAIARGALRTSPVLAERLAKAEAALASIEAARRETRAPVRTLVPRIADRYGALVDRLEKALQSDPEHGKAALKDVVGERIVLTPDAKRGHLWAEFALECAPLLAAAGASEIMVAGADSARSIFLRRF